MGPTGAKALADALASGMAVLKTLELQSNSIKDEGAIAIGESLKTNSTLEELDLGNNGIGPAGGQAIGVGLQAGTAVLTALNLQNNILDDAAKQSVRDAVAGRDGFVLKL